MTHVPCSSLSRRAKWRSVPQVKQAKQALPREATTIARPASSCIAEHRNAFALEQPVVAGTGCRTDRERRDGF